MRCSFYGALLLLFAVLLPCVAAAQATRQVTMTAYDTGVTTSSGVATNTQVVLARSPDLVKLFPAGTILKISPPKETKPRKCGYEHVDDLVGELRVAVDKTSARFTDRVDVFLPARKTRKGPDGKVDTVANVLGHCKVVVEAVGMVEDLAHLPKTQAELAAYVASLDTEVANAPD
jgi:3D (Asp-Asp-Asp) domain-containing protein